MTAVVIALAMLVACSAPHEDDRSIPRPISTPPTTGAGSSAASSARCGSGDSTTPPSPVAQLVASRLHACARLADGTVWCWGAREKALTDGDVIGPRPCSIATRVDELAVASRLVGDCALRTDDTMRCGDIESGRFDAPTPITDAVRGIDEEYATQTSTCRRRGRAVSCTRDGTDVTLDTNARRVAPADQGGWWIVREDGSLIRREVCAPGAPCMDPVGVPGKFIDVATAQGLECVVDSTGVVHCANARSPRPDMRQSPAFAKIDGVGPATQISVGEGHACAVVGTDVVCWGRNSCGQSGAQTMSLERCGGPDVPPTKVRWAK